MGGGGQDIDNNTKKEYNKTIIVTLSYSRGTVCPAFFVL